MLSFSFKEKYGWIPIDSMLTFSSRAQCKAYKTHVQWNCGFAVQENK